MQPTTIRGALQALALKCIASLSSRSFHAALALGVLTGLERNSWRLGAIASLGLISAALLAEKVGRRAVTEAPQP